MFSKALLPLCAALLLVAVTTVTASGGAAGAARLHTDLEKGYDRLVYPDNITLQVGISFVCVYMDEGHYRLSSRVVERYHWIDNRLRWDPKKYEDVDKVSVPANLIWTPDVHLQNAIMTEDRDQVHAVVLPTGDVYWIPPVNYKTRCADHPDEHHDYHCKLSLGSWTYDAKSIPLDLFMGGVDQKMYLDTCPFTIQNARASIKNTKYDCCVNPYATLNVEFDINKKKQKKDADAESSDDSSSDSGEEAPRHKPRHSYECPWPQCTLYD